MLDVSKWELVHWTILGGFLGGLGSQLSAITDWHDAMSPVFIGGVLIQISSLLLAIRTRQPGRTQTPGT